MLRKGRVWFTDKADDVRAEHGYVLRVLVVLLLALRPVQRERRFSRPCEDADREGLRSMVGRGRDRLALLPSRVREPTGAVRDDF